MMEKWNRFDFIVTCVSITAWGVKDTAVGSFFHTFRVLRVFRLARGFKGIYQVPTPLRRRRPSLLCIWSGHRMCPADVLLSVCCSCCERCSFPSLRC